jgi:hypothetical protein
MMELVSTSQQFLLLLSNLSNSMRVDHSVIWKSIQGSKEIHFITRMIKTVPKFCADQIITNSASHRTIYWLRIMIIVILYMATRHSMAVESLPRY